MSYPQGYSQRQYVGNHGYEQALQTEMYQAGPTQNMLQVQHPMVVIPQQPIERVLGYQSPHQVYQDQQQSGFYQQYSPQYPQPAQLQYYQPQSHLPQSFPPQHFDLYQNHINPRLLVQEQSFKPTHHNTGQHSTRASPAFQYQHQSPQLVHSGHQPQSSSRVETQRQSHSAHSRTSTAQPRLQPSTQVHQQYHQQPRHEPNVPSTMPPTSKRVVAHVEIPVYQPADTAEYAMPPSPKRQRSNDGRPTPVCEAPLPQKRSSQQFKQTPASSSPLTELASSQLPPTPQPDVDHQTVLLALADEYIHAAHSRSASLSATEAPEEKYEEYYALISTAMGCLDSVLKNYRQTDPRKEARIRLRLANLLIVETENDEEAEEILSKGITLCDRSRLLDLKYAMHHLLVRLAFKRSRKAASRAIDKLVQEVEALKLMQWVYTFRFLSVSFSLGIGARPDLASALKHLAAINALAEEQRHISVQILTAVLEAIVHLQSGSSDSIDLAQRAIAAARTHQLGPEMQRMPQLRALVDCLDLACSLVAFNPDRAAAKTQQMQTNLDTGTRGDGWSKDGSFGVELTSTVNTELARDTCGILRRDSEGHAVLSMQWMTGSQLYALGFLLSGLADMAKNTGNGKGEQFLKEGLKPTQIAPEALPQSRPAVLAGFESQVSLHHALRLHLIFANCARYDWAVARKAIKSMRNDFAQRGSEVDRDTARMLLYLDAVCRQGLGDLQSALSLYASPDLSFDEASKAPNAEKDLRALATLNRIMILQTAPDADPVQADNLMTLVEPHCRGHANQALVAACQLVKVAIHGSNESIIKTKQYLQSAVQASKAASNNQLLCIVMNMMTAKFYVNIATEQAESAARVGRSLASRTHDRLWMAVADGMYGDTLERLGNFADAQARSEEAQSLLLQLPEAVREAFQR